MEELEKSEPLDVVSTASGWSKVSKKTGKNRSHWYWLIGGILAVSLVMVMSLPKRSSSDKAPSPSVATEDFNSSLNANLARLKEMDNKRPDMSFQSINSEKPLVSTKHASKKYMARQNAPTSMYTNPVGFSRRSNSSSHSPQEATFAGNGSDANAQFGNANTTTSSVEAVRVPHPEFTMASGELLHAVIETAINSDLPGMVRAVVSQPAYAYTGDRTIVPAGSRLIGQYSSSLVQGQNRVMVIWSRIILPDGIAVQLNSPGTDSLGRAGQGADSVNTHFLARFGEAALLSIIGAGASSTGVGDGDQYNSAAQYRMAVAQSFQQSAQKSLQGTLPMKPTVHIHQGAAINVFVAHDLSFYHVLKNVDELPAPTPGFIK